MRPARRLCALRTTATMVTTGHVTAGSHVRTRLESGARRRYYRLMNEALINWVQRPEPRTVRKRLLSVRALLPWLSGGLVLGCQDRPPDALARIGRRAGSVAGSFATGPRGGFRSAPEGLTS